MSKRYARLFQDGSLSVEPTGMDLEEATRRLSGSSDDDDTQIVEVEFKIVALHGTPKMQVVTEESIECPCCGEEVWLPKPTTAAKGKQNG